MKFQRAINEFPKFCRAMFQEIIDWYANRNIKFSISIQKTVSVITERNGCKPTYGEATSSLEDNTSPSNTIQGLEVSLEYTTTLLETSPAS